MKNLYLTSLLILIVFNCFSQKIETIDSDKVCLLEPRYQDFEFVDEFKDELKLSIDIHKITIGTKEHEVEFIHTEYFKNESSIIKLSKKMALSVSVARVTENGNKYYLYKIHLFQKIKNCWEDKGLRHSWNSCTLGTLNHGYGIGYTGTSDFLGYSGILKIE